MATAKNPAPANLPKDVFAVDVPAKHDLLKVAYDAYLANARVATATTKTRGLVSGGGKKPWKQKGTGRARFGSSRNPIWRHGGVVFGPSGAENYKKRLSRTSKHVALRQALTLANTAGKIVTVANLTTTGKTREFADLLAKAGVADARRVLVVTDAKTPEMLRASNNVNYVVLVSARYLSVFHILNADRIVMTTPAVTAVAEWLTPQAKEAK